MTSDYYNSLCTWLCSGYMNKSTKRSLCKSDCNATQGSLQMCDLCGWVGGGKSFGSGWGNHEVHVLPRSASLLLYLCILCMMYLHV